MSLYVCEFWTKVSSFTEEEQSVFCCPNGGQQILKFSFNHGICSFGNAKKIEHTFFKRFVKR